MRFPPRLVLVSLALSTLVSFGCGDSASTAETQTEGATEDSGSSGEEGESSGSSEGSSGETTGSSEETGDPSEAWGLCENAQPIIDPDTGEASGYVVCEDGFIHRETAVACVLPPAGGTCTDDPDGGDACVTDDECTDAPNGRCVDSPDVTTGCGCVYSCESDADCGGDQICACSHLTGDVPRCVSAVCPDSDACADGLCGMSRTSNGCGQVRVALACMNDEADCRMASCPLVQECFGDEVTWQPSCRPIDGAWTCYDDSCDGNCG